MFELYNQAARLGDGEAMNWIGLMLVEGDGVEKKSEQVKAWFEKAAAAGYSDLISPH